MTPFSLVNGREATTTLDAMLPHEFDDIATDVDEFTQRAEEARQLAAYVSAFSKTKMRNDTIFDAGPFSTLPATKYGSGYPYAIVDFRKNSYDGIGKETAKELARRKARVILACRNLQRAQKAARDIFAETGEAVVVKQLDLCSFKSVRAFAEDVVRTEPRLDVLINNAGNIPDKLMLTEDGYEVGLQSNYLGHFLLTILLTELLKKSAPSRVVNLSSVLHHFGTTWRIEEQAKGTYGWRTPLLTYCNTKMAMVLFTRALAPRLKIHGVTVNAVHPGAVDTGIAGEERLIAYLFRILVNFYGRTAWEGAQTSLYAAVDDRFATDTGFYLEECARGIVSYRAINRKCVENTFARTISLCHLDQTEVEKLFELPGGRAA
nr:retinol dehydrogenase 12-like [Dermacentor andersoni]